LSTSSDDTTTSHHQVDQATKLQKNPFPWKHPLGANIILDLTKMMTMLAVRTKIHRNGSRHHPHLVEKVEQRKYARITPSLPVAKKKTNARQQTSDNDVMWWRTKTADKRRRTSTDIMTMEE
jgi:hypothetical protein